MDTSIVHARRALLEVTEELQERTYRWRQIELICGFQVVQNPGLPYLESLTRTLQRNISSMPRTGQSGRENTGRSTGEGLEASGLGCGGRLRTDCGGHSACCDSDQ